MQNETLNQIEDNLVGRIQPNQPKKWLLLTFPLAILFFVSLSINLFLYFNQLNKISPPSELSSTEQAEPPPLVEQTCRDEQVSIYRCGTVWQVVPKEPMPGQGFYLLNQAQEKISCPVVAPDYVKPECKDLVCEEKDWCGGEEVSSEPVDKPAYDRLYGDLYRLTYDPDKTKQSLYYRAGLDYQKIGELAIELEVDSVIKEAVNTSSRFIINAHFADVSETYLVDPQQKTLTKLDLIKGYTKSETIVAFLDNNQVIIKEFADEKISYYLSSLDDLTVKKKL